jgi:uncharacterized protein
MQYKSVKGFSGFGQLGMLVVFLGVGFILTLVVQLVIVAYMKMPPGTSVFSTPEALPKALMNPENVSLARLMQVLGTFSMFFIPAVLYSWITNGKSLFWLGFSKYLNAGQIVLGFFIILAATYMSAPLVDLSKSILAHFPSLDKMALRMEILYNEQVLALSNLKSWPEYIVALFIMAFFPALFEEVFFRGTLQNLLVKWWKRPMLAIFVASIIFSLIHASLYLFISRIILGFVLGLMYHKSKNIWVNIIAHFINNAIAVSQLFYLGMQKEKLDITKLDPQAPWWVSIPALAVLIALFILFDRYSANKKLIIETKEQVLRESLDPFRSFTNIENNEGGH